MVILNEKLIGTVVVFSIVGAMLVGFTASQPPVHPTSLTEASKTQEVIPTSTTKPTETATMAITPTPDFYHFEKFISGEAKINEATYKEVNFKFAFLDVSDKIRKIDPTMPEFPPFDSKMAIIYFITDKKEIAEKVISKNTYLNITFSDGKEEIVGEGNYDLTKFKLYGGYLASGPTEPLGLAIFFFYIPKEGMELTQLKIAESASQKDKAVVLFQK